MNNVVSSEGIYDRGFAIDESFRQECARPGRGNVEWKSDAVNFNALKLATLLRPGTGALRYLRAIFLRADSNVLRSLSVKLWMPLAEILSKIGSTSRLMNSPGETSSS